MKKLALHWKIIIGMVLGVVYGLIANQLGWVDFTNDWIKPWGKIFVNLLKLIAVPLVFASLIKGVASLSDISKLSRIGGKTIAIYLVSTVIAVTIGLLLVNTVKPGEGFDKDSISKTEQIEEGANKKIKAAENVKDGGPLQFLVDIVPTNIFDAASNNRNMLQVIFFAILFGIALVMIPNEKTTYVKGFFDGINDIILQIVDIIMMAAPYGVFALLGGLVVDFGASAELFISLAKYSVTVIVGLLLMILVVYPLILKIFTKMKYKDFFKGIMPAQMLAFSTSSSAATLPVTMERCEDHLGVSEEVSSFVLPLGATINMDGTSLYQAVAAVFIAQAFGYSLGLTDQLTIVLTATLASIGAAAVPGAGMIMLIIVLGSIPTLPSDIIAPGLALIFGVDRILDMMRTVVNVTGDATVATVVASTEGKLKEVTEEELMS
ncbi:MAG: dicarboxylate/amino acid:cation symporter [Flavobacteriales bacterium]|jgi:Na+/H+-dicarboxylate symporter|nr:dicarboxylate/amino acid:cation symporter [Flavobacteriales bacterium]MBT5699539.1 dicarboxylate/amino acid:cation symporter [Flavobacteriales bacterium]MBT6815272.1 dicarboxylate/amino acid:cation symporter [Flavobacteriales bacterium]MBT7620745.1 dicarboxylate/amino acid:cation symporter [Flavobacteriales bacterium]